MEIKERLSHARNIEIWVSPPATKYDTHIAHSLACALEQLGKRVQITSQNPLTSKNTCTVILRGLAPRIDEVTYEKDQDDLKLHFALQKGNLSPESISLEIAPQTDLTIIVGDKNTQYNYEKVYTYVLELLLNHTEASVRLLGTILFKLEYPLSGHIYTAYITQEDLTAALTEPKYISQVVESLRLQFGDSASYLFFFEKSPFVLQTLFWTIQPQLKEKLLHHPLNQTKGNWTLVDSSFEEKNLIHQQLLTS
jgi:hypothetical protein